MTGQTPKVSIVMPTYNRAHIIENPIKSVLSQTYQNFELLIVDDGSSDHTEDVITSFADPRIRYIRQRQNVGAAASRNTGIENATGQYIAFLDSDDEWFPEKVARQVQCLEARSEEVGVVYTWLKAVDAQGIVRKVRQPLERGAIAEDILFTNFVGTPSTVMVRSDYLKRVGGFDPQMLFEDWDLWIRLTKHCQFELIPEVLVSYLEAGNDRKSKNAQSIADSCLTFIQKHHQPIDFTRICAHVGSFSQQRKSECLFDLGRRLVCHGNVIEDGEAVSLGKQYITTALQLSPVNPYLFVQWLAVTLAGNDYLQFIAFENRVKRFLSRKVLGWKRT